VHAHRLSQHSSYYNLPYLRELQPRPWVKINPATAKEYGINDGDWMKIESPHGWVKMVAEYFEGIAPDVLMTRRGWWQACEELGLPGYSVFNGGAEPNVLYSGDVKQFDPLVSQMAKQTLVKISKA
jgi:thiosulfate reductase / polysulfide reductase chain A